MVKSLATDGVSGMGKINSQVFWFSVTLFVFVLSAVLDFEYGIVTIKGNGEVLGNASVLVGDVLVKTKEVQVPIKLMDAVLVILIVMLAINRKNYFIKIKQAVQCITFQKMAALIAAIFVLAAVSILVNSNEYTNSQLLLMSLYLIKLLQAVSVGIIIAVMVSERKISDISKVFLVSVLFSTFLLMLNKLGLIAIGTTSGDRMETFGVIIFTMIIILFFHQIESWETKIGMGKQVLYAATVFAGSVSILTCGKRGIEMTYLGCMVVLLLLAYLSNNAGRRVFALMFFLAFVVSIPKLSSDFDRTIGNTYDSIARMPHKQELINLLPNSEGLDNPVNATPKFKASPVYYIASKLDYSGADRIGRVIKTLRLSYENGFIGTGFQGTQYKYGYFPDSGLQFLLEIGLLGVFLLLLSVYYLIHALKKPYMTDEYAIAHVLLVVGTLGMLCVFCNQLYMPRFTMIFVFHIFLWVFYTGFMNKNYVV